MTQPTNAAAVLEVNDLRIGYATRNGRVPAVDGVSLVVQPGRTLGLVGESGSGKSSLGKGLMGLLPDGATLSGSVRLRGEEQTDLPAERRRQSRGDGMGLVFQEPMTRLDPLMKISEHFVETLRSHRAGMTVADARARSLLTLRGVGIPPTRFDQYPHEFSGGMRQRLMIALALVLEPAFIIADEPTTALDVMVEAQIIGILADLKKNFDTSLLLITHNLGLVAEACDDVAVMYAGRIVEHGPTRDVFRDPRHPYTRALLSSTISVETRELHYIDGSPPDLSNLPKGCRFNPRCAYATDQCRTEAPPTVSVGEGREAECWFPDELTTARGVSA